MVNSRLPTIIDNLVSGLDALISVPVYDGAVVTGDAAMSWVTIVYDSDSEGTFETASVEQDWAGIGAKAKSEEVTLRCAAVFVDADSNVKAARDGVYALFGEVETHLRGNISLGLPSPTVAEVRTYSYFQEPGQMGVEGRIVFEVLIRSRI